MKWLLFLGLAAATVGAVVLRRRMKDPDDAFGRWVEERLKPRLKDWVMGVFILTFLLWAAIYVTAPDDARDDLGESMKALWDSIGGDDAGKDETR